MISLKKFFTANDSDAKTSARAAWLILEAVACHAIEWDAAERELFQTSLRQIATRMDQSMEQAKSPETLLHVGEAIGAIESYNRGVQRSLNLRVKELQSMVSLFTRSLLQVSRSSAASATRLHEVERQIEKSSHIEDLRVLKVQLEQSLEVICGEAAEQTRRSDEISHQFRETMSRPEAAAVLAEAVSDLDLVTGLPNLRSAQRAIAQAIATGTSTYAVLLAVDRMEAINSRFGFAIGDRVLMLFGQHMAQRLSGGDQLFRWRGTTFLALIDRNGPEISIRAEVGRILATRMEQEIELGGRSVLLPIAASWMLTGVAQSTVETISAKLDAFLTSQSGASKRT